MLKIKKVLATILVISIGFSCSACGMMQKAIDNYNSDKEKCTLSNKITNFIYKSEEYTILEDSINEKDDLKWVGYLRKIAVADKDKNLIRAQDSLSLPYKDLVKAIDDNTASSYIISFGNIYTYQHGLCVEVDDKIHKAIPAKECDSQSQVIKFNKESNLNIFIDFN